MKEVKVGDKFVMRTKERIEVTRVCKKTLHFAIFYSKTTGFKLKKPYRFIGPKENFKNFLKVNGARSFK